MTETIIAFVDGSIYSESVCEHAAWIAGRTGAGVELIHVLGGRGAPKQDLSGAIRLGARSELLNELAELDARRAKIAAEHGRAILVDATAILERAGVEHITARLRHGEFVETVAELEADTRVIVIGKRGEAADFSKGALGSNLERVVRASARPVFVAARAFKPIESVLIAYDGGASADKAVDLIAGSPVFPGMTLRLVHVGKDTEAVRAKLDAARDKLAAAGLEVSADILPGAPEAVLGGLVEDEGYGLVVMGAYGHSRIRAMIIGSTTTEMIRSCRASVLLVR